MSTIPFSKIKEVKRLYYEKSFTMKEVADILGVEIDAVVYFMRQNKLERRTQSENQVRMFNKKDPSFSLKKKLTLYDMSSTINCNTCIKI